MSQDHLIYLTYGDMDSPVFATQVVGFCDFLENEIGVPVQIVSFVPLRLYNEQKLALAKYDRDIKVYPVVNRFQGKKWYSRMNARILSKIGGRTVMCRNPIAAELVKELKSHGWKSIYDARGCQYVEQREFSDASEAQISRMEQAEVASFRQADWVYAVSNALVEHFKNEHRYREHTFSVVPCCYERTIELTETKDALKERLLPGAKGVVFCYAGSLNVWNFPPAVIDLFRTILKGEDNRLVILSKDLSRLDNYRFLNDARVTKASVDVKGVKEWLAISDYSILLRKRAVTNKLASPSKFAEYLHAGTQVIISPEIGDLSTFVESNGCGVVYRNKKDNQVIKDLMPVDDERRAANRRLAEENFDRGSLVNRLKYRNLKTVHERMYNDLRAERG